MAKSSIKVNPGAGSDPDVSTFQDVEGDHHQSMVPSALVGGQPQNVGQPYPMPIDDPFLDIARGVRAKVSSVHKFGANGSVGTVEEDIWTPGGIYPWPTAAETVRVKAGGDANDDAAGTGARKVMIEGLDSSFNAVSEEVTLAGASASSPTSASFRRINRAYVTEVGTYTGTNAGQIQIENTTSLAVLADIAASDGQTEMSMYTVPNNFMAYLVGQTVTISGTKDGDARFWQRPGANDVTVPFQAKRIVAKVDGLTGEFEEPFRAYVEFAAMTDLWWSGVVDATTTRIATTYDLILVDQT